MPRRSPGSRESALARAIIDRTLRVQRGDSVTIETWAYSLPWANACYARAIEKGAHPIILYLDDPTFWSLVDSGHARELGSPGDHEYAALSKTDAYVFFEGPSDRARYHGLSDSSRQSIEAWADKWWSTLRKAGTRCAYVFLGRTVAETARYHGVPLRRWREELFEASLVNPDVMRRDGERIARRLASGRTVNIRHSNGTDLELRLRGRSPTVHDGCLDSADARAGHILEEVPSGYVPVAVDERYAEGTLRSNVPSKTMDGRTTLAGAKWSFSGGRLTTFAFDRGQAEFERLYAEAPPEGRDRPGILSFGLNPRLSMSPLVGDQKKGRLMFMIGGNRNGGGTNGNPFKAFLLLDGATVTVDGTTILRAGRIV